MITRISPLVFSVYIIHSQPIVRRAVSWNGLFEPLGRLSLPLAFLATIGSSVVIFGACIFIDVLRRKLFLILSVEKLCRMLDHEN